MEIRKNLIHEPSVGFDCITPSRTVQEFKKECNVNNIIDNYTRTGLLSHVNNKEPVFGDFSQIPKDYGEMVNLLNDSRDQFNSLPSKVRERFDNNPINLIKFLQDEKNRKEAFDLGLVKTPPDSVPDEMTEK